MKVAAWRLRYHEELRQLLDLPDMLMFERQNVAAKFLYQQQQRNTGSV